jgi:hypothetical protein
MAKSIVTVEIEIPGHSDKYLPLTSDKSLMDFEIIVFIPDISSMFGYGFQHYQGKLCLSDDASFTLKEKAARWRQELINAFNHGKTIFLFLSEVQDVFVATGTEDHSGSGRNRVITRHVEPFNNYRMVPIVFEELVSGSGREIIPAKDLGLLSCYWKDFGGVSQYQVYFASKMITPLLVTKTGSKTVGGLARGNAASGKGTIVVLPKLDIDEGEFTSEKDGKPRWNKKGMEFGGKLISALVEIDKSLNSEKQKTPTPDWVSDAVFRIQKESILENQIRGLSVQVEALQEQKRTLLDELEKEASLRRLLYENGPALEEAILDALGALGLKAEPYKDSESEFDVVFTWEGHRFLGEAEGKDSKAVNVDKISQLERNLSEDYAREEVTQYAKGILFGNAFRLLKLSDRGEYFTEKCVSSAKRIKAALVRTPDLFFAARYAKESGDVEFCRTCIDAILSAEGVVVSFPLAPTHEGEVVIENKDEGV